MYGWILISRKEAAKTKKTRKKTEGEWKGRKKRARKKRQREGKEGKGGGNLIDHTVQFPDLAV